MIRKEQDNLDWLSTWENQENDLRFEFWDNLEIEEFRNEEGEKLEKNTQQMLPSISKPPWYSRWYSHWYSHSHWQLYSALVFLGVSSLFFRPQSAHAFMDQSRATAVMIDYQKGTSLSKQKISTHRAPQNQKYGAHRPVVAFGLSTPFSHQALTPKIPDKELQELYVKLNQCLTEFKAQTNLVFQEFQTCRIDRDHVNEFSNFCESYAQRIVNQLSHEWAKKNPEYCRNKTFVFPPPPSDGLSAEFCGIEMVTAGSGRRQKLTHQDIMDIYRGNPEGLLTRLSLINTIQKMRVTVREHARSIDGYELAMGHFNELVNNQTPQVAANLDPVVEQRLLSPVFTVYQPIPCFEPFSISAVCPLDDFDLELGIGTYKKYGSRFGLFGGFSSGVSTKSLRRGQFKMSIRGVVGVAFSV